MSDRLEASYRYCVHVARTQARNFYYSFLCLPPQKRKAMCAVYAFMRFSDDISDAAEEGGGGERAQHLDRWRAALDAALAGDAPPGEMWPAFVDTVRRYAIPAEYLHAVIDGTAMDLQPCEYRTWDDTYRYCYHVASVVGLVCIHVFGFKDSTALKFAEYNGVAFQLTNILRDLREDAQMGRLYLPREDLERFAYTWDDLRAGRDNAAFQALMRFEVERAREYYDRAAPLLRLVDADSRPCLAAMRAIYGGILDRIVAQDYDVFTRRARVPTWRKVVIASEAWLQSRSPRRDSISSA